MRKLITALTVTTALTMASAAAEDIVLVHAGTLLAVPGQAAKTQQTVVIADGKVRSVMAGYVEAAALTLNADDKVIATHDLKDSFVLPGLIDCHVHITSENSPTGRLDAVQMSNPDDAIHGAYFAHKTLMAGFTTVRDVGAESEVIFALRDGIAKGWVDGPRIYASGNTISVTGGHGDGTQGYRDDIAEVLRSPAVCDGADSCRHAVREQIRRGADHIKLTATGGVLSNTAAGLGQQFFDDELKAIMDTAHSMGRKVTAHAHGADGINAALKAGVDSIEHGTYLDDESIRLFKKTGAYLVPTILAGVTVSEWANDPNSFLTPPQRAKAKEVGPRMLSMAGKAHRGGVKIAFGTDSGVSTHGQNARELQLMVQAGMSPMQAITAATVNAADNINQSDNLGTLEAGKFADIIAVKGDPLTDVSTFMNVSFVMKEGVVYKGE